MTTLRDSDVENTATLSSCRLCQSPGYKKIATEFKDGKRFTIVRCRDCGLVYTRETYSAVSPDYIHLAAQDINEGRLWLQGKHKERAFRQCLRVISSVQPAQSQKSLRLLDVGCGCGGWLAFASSRYEPYGFDASASQAAYAQERIPTVRCAVTLRQYKKAAGNLPKFDLITLWDVLEHIREPRELLTDLKGSLAPGGLLFASVPAATPMCVKEYLLGFGWPRKHFSWSPQEHVAYYSPKTIRLICQEAGLRILKVGAVTVYPRQMCLFEALRRTFFSATRAFPWLAPQIYVLAGN